MSSKSEIDAVTASIRHIAKGAGNASLRVIIDGVLGYLELEMEANSLVAALGAELDIDGMVELVRSDIAEEPDEEVEILNAHTAVSLAVGFALGAYHQERLRTGQAYRRDRLAHRVGQRRPRPRK